jgi:catechol 2,3-dioxygenase-like lactoylglutathione lyase family enzyme
MVRSQHGHSEGAMTHISYMAVMCREPERLGRYYQRWFGFEELRRDDHGTLYLTDGAMTMGLLQQGAAHGEPNQEFGLHHIGFWVESIDEIDRRLREVDPAQALQPAPAGNPYATRRIIDPEGILIDLSEQGYGALGQKRIPGIRHIAMACEDPERKFAFYSQVFGMRDVERQDILAPRQLGRPPSRFAGDGFINLALLTWPVTEPRRGFNHFGILASEPHELMYRISAVDPTRLDQRPPDRFAEYRIWDPEGNALDLSEKKGYQVDVDQVDRIA